MLKTLSIFLFLDSSFFYYFCIKHYPIKKQLQILKIAFENNLNQELAQQMEIQDPKMDSIKIYSRKQVINWISSFSYPSARFEQLNNGTFFCYLLKDIFPQQFSKARINEKPVGVFQCTNNLNLMKKVLNRHGYQMNINVQTIVTCKNCFQLANWFRNLAERCNIIDLSVINNRQSLNNTKTSFLMSQARIERQSSAKRSQVSNKSKRSEKSLSITQRKQSNHKLMPTERGYYNKNGNKNSQIINVNKSTTFDNIKIPRNNMRIMNDAKSVQSGSQNQRNQIVQNRNFFSENCMQNVQIDPFQLLQEQSILENIQQFHKIISRIKQYVENSSDGKQNSNYELFKTKVLSCIYKRP